MSVTTKAGGGGIGIVLMSPAVMPLVLLCFYEILGNVVIKLLYDSTLISSLSLCECLAVFQLILSAVF